MWVTGWAAAALAVTTTGDTGAAPPDGHTGAVIDTGPDPDTDADGDGWSLGEGDCDDADPLVNPGQPDVCFDRVDNDCSSLVDEGCDDSARLGSLGGGGGCTADSNIAGTGTALVVPFWWFGRRRRKG